MKPLPILLGLAFLAKLIATGIVQYVDHHHVVEQLARYATFH